MNTDTKTGAELEFTPETFARFKKAYEAVKDDPDAVFEFEGKPVLAAYAKYVIEYLEDRFQEMS